MLGRLFNRFARDERGVFAIMFGLMAITLVSMGGAVVDYVHVDQVRSRTQIALDAAALALQHKIYTDTDNDLILSAQKLVEERIDDDDITVDVNSVETDTEEGMLRFGADVTVPMTFVSLLGIDQMTPSVISQVTRKKQNIEVAFVLDNSGSMGGTKISKLKTATKNAINILFYGSASPSAGATKAENTSVAIVPFTFFVNVGKGYANSSWVDRVGDSIIAKDNFDDDDDSSTEFTDGVDRIALMATMQGQEWKGCFEARLYPYSVNDATPVSSDPATMFVPEFAPDEPGDAGTNADNYYNSYIDDDGGTCTTYPTWVMTGTKKKCNSDATDNSWAYTNCSSNEKTTYLLTYSNGSTSTNVTAEPTTIEGYAKIDCEDSYSGTRSGWGWGRYTNKHIRTCYYGKHLGEVELQERMCKYQNASISMPSNGYLTGPNAACPDASVQTLTDDVTSLISSVNDMVASGGTNIHEGTAWGFRALSPTEPLTQGGEYDAATSKVLVVMTDGENTYYVNNSNENGTTYYMPYGYRSNSERTSQWDSPRVGTYGTDLYADENTSESNYTMKLKMNDLTLETCENAKDAGITIFTIGLGTSDGSTKTMLTSCATSSDNAYFPSQASELDDVFESIAEQLSQLRIEK